MFLAFTYVFTMYRVFGILVEDFDVYNVFISCEIKALI